MKVRELVAILDRREMGRFFRDIFSSSPISSRPRSRGTRTCSSLPQAVCQHFLTV
jgi:hypothetical protein